MFSRTVRAALQISAVLVSLVVMTSRVAAAPAMIKDSTLVVVAEDKTRATDCQEWTGSATNVHPCAAGTLVIARITVFAEVKRQGIKYYAVATGDQRQDDSIGAALVRKVFADSRTPLSQPLVAQDACSNPGTRTFGASYLVDPNNPNSTRVSLQASYRVTLDQFQQCIVNQIKDQAKVSTGTWRWLKTCVRAVDVACTTRNVTMTTAFSPFFGTIDNSAPGGNYVHISDRPSIFQGRPFYQRTFT